MMCSRAGQFITIRLLRRAAGHAAQMKMKTARSCQTWNAKCRDLNKQRGRRRSSRSSCTLFVTLWSDFLHSKWPLMERYERYTWPGMCVGDCYAWHQKKERNAFAMTVDKEWRRRWWNCTKYIGGMIRTSRAASLWGVGGPCPSIQFQNGFISPRPQIESVWWMCPPNKMCRENNEAKQRHPYVQCLVKWWHCTWGWMISNLSLSRRFANLSRDQLGESGILDRYSREIDLNKLSFRSTCITLLQYSIQ